MVLLCENFNKKAMIKNKIHKTENQHKIRCDGIGITDLDEY